MSDGRKIKLTDRLSFKLARRSVLLAFILGFALSALQLYLDFEREKDSLEGQVNRILTVAEPPAARAVHILDPTLANEVTQGLMRYSFVRSATILDDLGASLASLSKDDVESSTAWITKSLTEPQRDYAKDIRQVGSNQALPGKLIISVDFDTGLSAFYGRSKSVFVTGVIREMVLVLALYFLFHFAITRPLTDMNRNLEDTNLENPNPEALKLGKDHNADELGMVVHKINSMFRQIGFLLKERKQTEEALRRSKDQLETHVEERTRELKEEIQERQKIQAALTELNENLEEKVEERTIDLLKAKEAAEYANRAKGEFLANMSHELRTPLNSILGFSDIMRQEALGPIGNERYRGYAGDIHHSGSHLLVLIRDILDVSKIEAGAMTLEEADFGIHDLMESCRIMVRERAEKGKIQLFFDCAPELTKMRGDQTRCKQILINLLSNAIKFSPKNAVVALVAKSTEDGGFTFEVIDEGIGIPKEDLARVLAPFEQVRDILSRPHEGSGLGLTIVKNMVELHDGTLGLDSEVGKGTTVTVTMPANRNLSSADQQSFNETVNNEQV